MVTILDVAVARGVKENADGSINMGQLDEVGLPFFGGCERCGESLACYNMYPTRTGNVRCARCAEGLGFETAADFEAFYNFPAEQEAVHTSQADLDAEEGAKA